jgi:putative acetyltransferase
MVSIRASEPRDGERVVEIWRDAVDATHDFLTPADRAAIEEEVRGFLPSAPLSLWVDEQDRPLGFMLLSGDHIEALFVDPACHGRGIGRSLIDHALRQHPALTTDVNEQNAQAMGFYERIGFNPTGRSPTDSEGRPYPLIHLHLQPLG